MQPTVKLPHSIIFLHFPVILHGDAIIDRLKQKAEKHLAQIVNPWINIIFGPCMDIGQGPLLPGNNLLTTSSSLAISPPLLCLISTCFPKQFVDLCISLPPLSPSPHIE